MIGQMSQEDYQSVSMDWLMMAAQTDDRALAELQRRLSMAATGKSVKHGDHDQFDHGNWAHDGQYEGTGTKEDPIRTSNVEVAARALGNGQYVQLDSPDRVATMLDKLNEIAKDAGANGKKVYDLCKVTVPGTNLFCVDSKGIPRIQMPQLKGIPTEGSPGAALERDKRGEVDITQGYLDSLRAQGVTLTEDSAMASHLKATQSELNGEKVAGIMAAAREGTLDINQPLVVSSDGYIVDGHHRWAAKVALEYDGVNDPVTDIEIPIVRVDQDIIDILASSKEYAAQMGIPQSAVKRLRIKAVKHADHEQLDHGNRDGAQTISDRLDEIEKEIDKVTSSNDQQAASKLFQEHEELVWRAAREGYDALLKPGKSTKHGDHDQSEHGNWANGGGGNSEGSGSQGGLARAVEKVRENEGATLPVTGSYDEWGEDRLTVTAEEPKTGYAVATGIAGKIVPAADFFEREKGIALIDGFLEQNAQHFANPDHHLGLWHNTKDGNVYLDITEVFDSSRRDEAIAAGSSRNQISIWDLENKVEIPTGGTGELSEGKAYVSSKGARRFEDVARGAKEGRRFAVRRS